MIIRDISDGEKTHETNLFNDLLYLSDLPRTFFSLIKGQWCKKGCDVMKLSELSEGKV